METRVRHAPLPATILRHTIWLLLLLWCANAWAQVDNSGMTPTEWGSERDGELQEDQSLEQISVPGKRVDLSLDLPSGNGPWVVASAVFECDHSRCQEETYREQMLAIAGIEVEKIYDRDAFIRALNRLARVELFQKLHGSVQLIGNGEVRVHFFGEAATLIERIRIRSGPFPQESIKRRISLRSGGFWDPEEIPRQQYAIREYFERQGLYGTDIDVTAVPAGEHAVDINIRIGRGQRLTINRIHVRGNTILDYDEIAGIVLDEFNFLSSFAQSDVQQAIDAVLQEYRARGYIQARFERNDIRVDDDQRSVDLFLEIREGPRWNVTFVGNRVFSDDALKKNLTFYETGFIDDVEVANAVREVRALYETRGHFFAHVDVTQRRDPDGERHISFRIDEGLAAEIRAIEVVGNTVFSRQDILEKMRTSEYDLITPSGYLQRARLNEELQQLTERYHEAGYLGVQIPRVVMVGQEGGRDLYLTIFIEEGERTDIDSVLIQGGAELDPEKAGERHERALKRLHLKQGRAWSAEAQREDLERIRSMWAEDGFGLTEVEVTCIADDFRLADCQVPPQPQECRISLARDVDDVCQRTISGDTIVEECQLLSPVHACAPSSRLIGAKVEVEFNVLPGVPTQLGRVFTIGNFATKDRVILQELPLFRSCLETRRRRLYDGWEPYGDCPYDPDQLLNMQANLRSLGVFDSVRIDAIGPDEDLDDVSLVIKVEEGQTRYLDYRVGIDLGFADADRTVLSLPNEVIYRDLNFIGRAHELRLEGRFEPSMTSPGQTFDGLFDADLRAIYFDPRSYIFGRWRRPWEARAEIAATWNQLAPAPVPQTRTLGIDLRVRNRIRRYTGVFYELGISMRQTAARDTTDGLIDAPFQRVRILSFSPKLTVELRDNPLNPTRGYFGEVSLEFAEDFFGLLGTESFTRFQTRHSGYIPLGSDVILALGGRFGVGFGSIYNRFRSDRRLSLPLGERFLMGGVNSVRGFSRDSIRASGTDEVGGDVMFTLNAELRYPLIRSLDIYGTVFVDAGQLAVDMRDLRWDETRISAGLGVRWLIAGLLPVLIDYGANLNRRPGEGFGLLHFSIGYTF